MRVHVLQVPPSTLLHSKKKKHQLCCHSNLRNLQGKRGKQKHQQPSGCFGDDILDNISILVGSKFIASSPGKKEHARYFGSVLIRDNYFRILTSERQETYCGEKGSSWLKSHEVDG
jgi:hypothetical protein